MYTKIHVVCFSKNILTKKIFDSTLPMLTLTDENNKLT